MYNYGVYYTNIHYLKNHIAPKIVAVASVFLYNIFYFNFLFLSVQIYFFFGSEMCVTFPIVLIISITISCFVIKYQKWVRMTLWWSIQMIKSDHKFVLTDLKKLARSFGLGWNFCTSIAGWRINCTRVYHQRSVKRHR